MKDSNASAVRAAALHTYMVWGWASAASLCSEFPFALPQTRAPTGTCKLMHSSLLCFQLEPPEMDQDSQSHASVSWVVDPKQDSKRTLSTKYETTIF